MTTTATAPGPAPAPARARGMVRNAWSTLAIPIASIVLALVVGAVIIWASELIIPGETFDPWLPLTAYTALVQGSLGNFNAIVNSLVVSSSLILAGLSVAFGFKAGLFNIGANGQFLMGLLGSVMVG